MSRSLDLLVVGAGPTGIAIGAEAKREGFEVLLVDRGPLLSNLLDFPTFMQFFTTRDLLEVAGIPLAIPQDKPDRRQAIAYYQSIVRQFDLPIAPHEEVLAVHPMGEQFEIETVQQGQRQVRRSRAVALATGYFHRPRRLGVKGEDLPWVQARYLDPYALFGRRVVVVGGGNSAVETCLDLYRNGAEVTLVHRGESVKPSIKYWLRPDFQNRLQEGGIRAHFRTRVVAFRDQMVDLEGP